MPRDVKKYAVDNPLPEVKNQPSSDRKRITYVKKNGVTEVHKLKGDNKYHQILICAFNYSLYSDWFRGISTESREGYFNDIKNFINWINESEYKTTSKTRYSILKDFEANQLNERGVKNSRLAYLKRLLSEGAACPSFTNSDFDFLQTLLTLSKPTNDCKRSFKDVISNGELST